MRGSAGQPLLHTWSLGVEEQFYLFWPLLIFICFRLFSNSEAANSSQIRVTSPSASSPDAQLSVMLINRKTAAILLLIAVISGWACYVLAASSYNLAFYMFYTRAIEFCIGGFVALEIVKSSDTGLASRLTGLLGIVTARFQFFFR